MRVLQIVYFFVVGVPVFILAYCVIEVADFGKNIAARINKIVYNY
jgi:hypothetical protein